MATTEYDNPITRSFRTDDEKALIKLFVEYLKQFNSVAISTNQLDNLAESFISTRLPK